MKKRIDTSPPPARGLQRPFAALAERLGTLAPATGSREGAPEGAAPSPSAARDAPAEDARALPGPPAASAAPPRAVVRLERKGRGGKSATVVEKLALDVAGRERWLAELKSALGCGGAVEGEALVLQGDLRARVKTLLERRGVRKVTLG